MVATKTADIYLFASLTIFVPIYSELFWQTDNRILSIILYQTEHSKFEFSSSHSFLGLYCKHGELEIPDCKEISELPLTQLIL